ncbi:MAG: hypothetical protein NPIRA06_17590 [Nitrospirales bacterium]|nr:MAG: hypothetical protein NPIRA06_17590 [Nitrospirales bacterium]
MQLGGYWNDDRSPLQLEEGTLVRNGLVERLITLKPQYSLSGRKKPKEIPSRGTLHSGMVFLNLTILAMRFI